MDYSLSPVNPELSNNAVTDARGFLRRLYNAVGAALSVLALGVFLFAFAKLLSADEIKQMVSSHWGSLFIALGLYVLAYIPMTIAWIFLARKCCAVAESNTLTWIFLISQIGKYLPGNVAQFFGRAYLAKQNGVSLKSSGFAMVLELAGVLAAGCLCVALSASLGTNLGTKDPLPWIAGALVIIIAVGSYLFLRTRFEIIEKLIKPLLLVLILYVGVFALLSGANIVLMGGISGDWSISSMWRVAGALMISWLIGFVTPGAPAGIGLRELSFYSLLASSYTEASVLFAAAGFRLVTLSGDALALAAGMTIRFMERRQSAYQLNPRAFLRDDC